MALRSQLKTKVLQFFMTNESQSVYINDLARRLKADPKNLYRTLVQLEREGILQSEFKGKERYFSAQTKASLYKVHKTLFMQTHGVDILIKQALKKYRIDQAYIFGSYASGSLGPQSDVDLLIVSEEPMLAIEKSLRKVAKDIGREINTVHLTPEEFQQKREKKDTFLKTVFKNKTLRVI